MKKFRLSFAAWLAMSTFAAAGGDITPVEPVVETPMVEESTGSFYAGLGYSYMNMNISSYTIEGTVPEEDHNSDAVLLLAGYNFNPYIGVEARYSGLTDCLENSAIHLKPMYPFGSVTLYGLLGYGQVQYDNGTESLSESGFQWGLGANYGINDNVAVFVDYTKLYDDNGFDNHLTHVNHMADAVSVGFTYAF